MCSVYFIFLVFSFILKLEKKVVEIVFFMVIVCGNGCSDLQGIRTNARRDGDDWILNGSKVFITNGYMSGVVIVVAITNPDAKTAAHGISLFLVEEGMPGFKKGKKLQKVGLKAQVQWLM